MECHGVSNIAVECVCATNGDRTVHTTSHDPITNYTGGASRTCTWYFEVLVKAACMSAVSRPFFLRHGVRRRTVPLICMPLAYRRSPGLSILFWLLDVHVFSRYRAIELDPSNHVFYSNRR